MGNGRPSRLCSFRSCSCACRGAAPITAPAINQHECQRVLSRCLQTDTIPIDRTVHESWRTKPFGQRWMSPVRAHSTEYSVSWGWCYECRSTVEASSPAPSARSHLQYRASPTAQQTIQNEAPVKTSIDPYKHTHTHTHTHAHMCMHGTIHHRHCHVPATPGRIDSMRSCFACSHSFSIRRR